VLVETEDFLYRLQYIIGTGLNGVLVLQFLLYWNSKPVGDDSKKVKKE